MEEAAALRRSLASLQQQVDSVQSQTALTSARLAIAARHIVELRELLIRLGHEDHVPALPPGLELPE